MNLIESNLCEPWTRRYLSLTVDYLKNEDVSIYLFYKRNKLIIDIFPTNM